MAAADVTQQFSDKYIITDRKLGSGAYGQVHMVINQFTHRQVACKIVSLRNVRQQHVGKIRSSFFGHYDRPRSVDKVNQHAQLMKINDWGKRKQQEALIEDKMKKYDREAEILASISHPNIIRLEKVIKTDGNM